MIRLKTIHIEEFRGIRKLDLDLAAKNFGICGPNGTGKSGVVDAIEFCLTGDVTRLSGQGTSGLSVRSHAPHVDQCDHPNKASVTITADIPSLGKVVQIRRSVKNLKTLEVTPEGAEIERIVQDLEAHPEFALSRREIVKYIVTPPGKRSEDVQTLLRLDHLDKVRKAFTSFRNKQRIEAEGAERELRTTETDLKNALRVDKLNEVSLLEKINESRQVLGLPALANLPKDGSLKASTPGAEQAERKPSLRKAVALADLTALTSAIDGTEPVGVTESRQAAEIMLEELSRDKQVLTAARRYGFLKTGLELVTQDACPLCDTPWKAAELRKRLRQKLLTAEEIAKTLSRLRDNVSTILESLTDRIQAVERAIEYSLGLQPPIPHAEIASYRDRLTGVEAALKTFLGDHTQLVGAIDAVRVAWWLPAAAERAGIDECHAAVKALPDTSAEDDARDILTIAQERYERYLRATNTAKEFRARNTHAQKVLTYYNTASTVVLEGIYDRVTKDFADYYRAINREDEDKFVGKLTSAPAKLSFDVDFYGRGLFPPGAYHSEGHQDAMGLCLYLALMKETLGDKFTFAVLDDVLMSVDTGHRREVCRLLKSKFPHTQFILTTHDRIWLQYMKTEGLISRSQLFGGWTVDGGPLVWDDQEIWTEIQDELYRGNVPQAAWLLRRYLEYMALILADNLRVRVEFRGDGRYDLGDLMPHVLKEWRRKLEEGEKCATYWKREDLRALISTKRARAKELVARTNAEQWAINPSVHFNEWVNLQGEEFQEIVSAFKDLFENLRCDKESCRSYLYILPRRGTAEELRCNCGATNINLKVAT